MNKSVFLLIVSMLTLTAATRMKTVSGMIESNIGDLSFTMTVPSPFRIERREYRLECIDTWFLIKYFDRSMLYVCNCGSWTPNADKYPPGYEWGFDYPITNNDQLSFGTGYPTGTFLEDSGTFAMADSLCLSGLNNRSRYWKEIQYKDVCIGYTNVPERRKALFDESLATFKILSVQPTPGRWVR